MNKRYLILLIYGLLNINSMLAQTGSVTISVSGIEKAKGVIWIGLFNSDEGFPVKDNCFKGVQIKARISEVSHVFTQIPQGFYAIATWHDEDEDGTMNKNLFGVPKESYGFSLNKYGTLGPPEFDNVSFEIKSNQSIDLKINLQ